MAEGGYAQHIVYRALSRINRNTLVKSTSGKDQKGGNRKNLEGGQTKKAKKLQTKDGEEVIKTCDGIVEGNGAWKKRGKAFVGCYMGEADLKERFQEPGNGVATESAWETA